MNVIDIDKVSFSPKLDFGYSAIVCAFDGICCRNVVLVIIL
jgi:hypothetical protein